jgi:hypothetical protein
MSAQKHAPAPVGLPNTLPTEVGELSSRHAALRQALIGCDAQVHHLTRAIVSTCRAAASRLTFDPSALHDVAVLLDLAAERAVFLGDYVDALASDQGCSASEAEFEPGSELRHTHSRLYAEWHALVAEHRRDSDSAANVHEGSQPPLRSGGAA